MKKTDDPLKFGPKIEQAPHKRRYTNGQPLYEKMFTILSTADTQHRWSSRQMLRKEARQERQ